MKRVKFFHIILGIFLLSSCDQSPSLPTPNATEPQASPVILSSTATSEVVIPAGWASATHSSQQCKYAISYPTEFEVTDQNPYSRTFGSKMADPDEGARNFIYASVIDPEIQDAVKQGTYQSGDVYNFNPAETDVLLNMKVGESKAVRDLPNVETGFTYERKPDTQLSDHSAQTYVNAQPWEFPAGTKEIRYYLSSSGCIYLIGGYMDATGSEQQGAITEDLFHQIVGTFKLMP